MLTDEDFREVEADLCEAFAPYARTDADRVRIAELAYNVIGRLHEQHEQAEASRRYIDAAVAEGIRASGVRLRAAPEIDRTVARRMRWHASTLQRVLARD